MRSLGNFTHIIFSSRTVYYCHSGYTFTNFEAHEIAADMTHADMHAFIVTLHQIHTQAYLYSLPSYPATIGYFLHQTCSSLQWEHIHIIIQAIQH